MGIDDEDFSFIKGDAWEVRFLGNQPFNLGKVSLSCLMEREGFQFFVFLQHYRPPQNKTDKGGSGKDKQGRENVAKKMQSMGR